MTTDERHNERIIVNLQFVFVFVFGKRPECRAPSDGNQESGIRASFPFLRLSPPIFDVSYVDPFATRAPPVAQYSHPKGIDTSLDSLSDGWFVPPASDVVYEGTSLSVIRSPNPH